MIAHFNISRIYYHTICFNSALVVFIHTPSASNLLNILRSGFLVFIKAMFLLSQHFFFFFFFAVIQFPRSIPTKYNIQGFPFLSYLCFLLIKYVFVKKEKTRWNKILCNSFAVSFFSTLYKCSVRHILQNIKVLWGELDNLSSKIHLGIAASLVIILGPFTSILILYWNWCVLSYNFGTT